MAFQKGNTYSKGQIPWNKGKTGIYSEETIKKMSDSRIGHTSWNKGITGYKLKPCTEEQKEFLRQLNTGNNYNLGHKHSEETKLKMSKSMTGHRWTEEQKQNAKGRVFSEAHKKKISLTRIKIRDKYSGKNSPNWKGGISFEPYCVKFNNNFKESIRNKFNRICFICGKTEELNGQRLSIHHISYDKTCLCENMDCKFVPLCVSCHSKTNHNRDYYETSIMNKINNMGSIID